MQAIRVDSGGRTLFYFADALPTSAHVPIPWIMAYDLYPIDLIENKKRLLAQAVRDHWLCVFEHDPGPLGISSKIPTAAAAWNLSPSSSRAARRLPVCHLRSVVAPGAES